MQVKVSTYTHYIPDPAIAGGMNRAINKNDAAGRPGGRRQACFTGSITRKREPTPTVL